MGAAESGTDAKVPRTGLDRLLWGLWLPVAARAARVGVAGPDLADALRVCRGLGEKGFRSTICYWNLPGAPTGQVVAANLDAVQALHDAVPGGYLSLKAPEFGFSAALVSEVARAGAQAGVGIHFDSHGPEVADATFECIAAAGDAGADVGCTLPGRWRRSLADANLAVTLGAGVRVVKGQWPDPEAPDADPAAGFLAVVERLAGRARRVSVASHDPVVVRAGIEKLRAAGTPCDVELLFGLPVRRASQVAAEIGVPVRMYVPYGHGWLAHCLKQVSRNPRILWWILRDMLVRRGIPGA